MTRESTAYAADVEAVKQVVATVEHSQQHKGLMQVRVTGAVTRP
ncbi:MULTISPECIES: hypothetical protein [Streptomyces]|nr:hypothetical protein [Streptomyces canarius]